MSRAEELANTHEADPWRRAKWERNCRAELRRLSAVEAELIALKKAIGDAERFDAFPWVKTGAWEAVIFKGASTMYARETADTAAKAVALAVIKSKEQE